MSEKISQLLDKTRAIEGMLSFLTSAPEDFPARDSLLEILCDAVSELHSSVEHLRPVSAAGPYVAIEVQEEEEAKEAQEAEKIELHIESEPATEPEAVPETVPETETETKESAEEAVAEATEMEEAEDACPDIPAPGKRVGDAHAQMKISIGDRYRFRRELFNFSDEEMDEALQIAAEMSTKPEVEDYFYNDLCFNPENPDVADFMRLVCARFN